jgi:uncharacterized protein (DUF927 family)
MDIDAFILLLAGRTSGGKTTTLLPAASAIGISTKKRIPTWKNTDAGLETWAHIEYPDQAFPIDELSHVGSESKVFEKIDEAAYMFDAGANKKKHDATASAQSGRPRRVTGSSSIVITSYERTLAEIEAVVGRQFRPGVRVRVVEIPMSLDKNAEGIFDRLPEGAGEGAARTKFANDMVGDLRRACAKNSGKVFVAYIKEIVADLKTAEKFVRARMEWFTENTKFDRTNREEYRRIEHFAFLYGAGAYAIKLGFLPWSRQQLLKAIRACYRASRASAATAPNPKVALESNLMQHLHDDQRVVQWPKRGHGAMDGPQIDGWKRQEGSHTLYRVKASAFRQRFPLPDVRAAVEDLMVSKGWLVRGKNASCCRQERVPGGAARIGVYQLQIPIGGE